MRDPYDVSIAIGPQRHTDQLIAGLAGGQHDIVEHSQLAALGIGAGAIKHRIRCGRLHRQGRGVYSVGTELVTPDGRRMVAVLAAGPGAVLSGRSAGALHQLRRWSGTPEVAVPVQRRPRSGLILCCSPLAPDEVTGVRGIPVTTVARTILDLAVVLSRDTLEAVMREAEFQGASAGAPLRTLLARHPRRNGTPMLREILASGRVGDGVSRNEFEELFGRLALELRLPPAKRNWNILTPTGPVEGDYVWPEQRVNVELDGWQSHGRRSQFERDRARDRRVTAAGWTVIRITWKQLIGDWDAVGADIYRSISSAGTAPSRSTVQVPSAS
jgi:hypothetical protein